MRKGIMILAGFTGIIYLLLLIPGRPINHFAPATSTPFTWNMDTRWQELQMQFEEARLFSAEKKDSFVTQHRHHLEQLIAGFETAGNPLLAEEYPNLLNALFNAAPIVAASGETDWFIRAYNQARRHVKYQSRNMDLNDQENRAMLYRLLYGLRAAVEEVLLQQNTTHFNPVQQVTDEPSVTPSAVINGIHVHSGDLLVSRGGAEVSAFISRGNDYPGNFSHVALLHVDEAGKASLIEAHIEKGVALATVDEYLKDKKLRFMVLRPRADLPQLIKNPMLPHRAAQTALAESNRRHIPYDFKMNFYDSSAMFCSEVGSYAYRKNGIQLWQAVSTISSAGVASWLSAFGVENFVTQMPSDLEYDPQLSVVAEYCDPETLFKDHLDNAVMDVLYEQADKGKQISYIRWLLPVARIIKGYSIIQNTLGYPGIIPEGMTATQALKNSTFVALYQETRQSTREKVDRFITEKKYRPPYWELVNMARKSVPN
ncbi:MAG: hypothetical protein HRU69_00190 [Flammeovirgaceae bacterium]|nr:MAG: hypothetical protein HRU69_00190 [Flammeovirgaceae bacterium]